MFLRRLLSYGVSKYVGFGQICAVPLLRMSRAPSTDNLGVSWSLSEISSSASRVYMEGQGGLASTIITPMIHGVTPVIPMISLLLKAP